ncbi:putative uncharacterized protein C6orf183 [Leuresthes tenuis]|uniref:putative uncharacterized protein C6orf183 n=1 Tax=Leuresthes tenuis TaxID=355514 RepID=UPI003B50CA73
MFDMYKASSSIKVKQLEAELSEQLAALLVEIQGNGFPHGAGPLSLYSSVLPPKDISFFRVEREHALRRGLQVAEALPFQSQADAMQRELESCLSLEYSPDSLPILLHQFFVDRSCHLAQIKYLLMLRWRRFCHHSSIIAKLYPHYKDQMLNLTREYEDAVQRARRLSASRERTLMGRGNPASLLALDDVVIYLQWLVCHLHSAQTIHNFLRVLHYIPAWERKDKEPQQVINETQHFGGIADNVPLHTLHLDGFLPELQSLITFFQLPYDTGSLRTTADEMELFSMVWRKFREIFRRQEQMKTFPQYDGTDVRGSQGGRKSAHTALRKDANWVPFIQVKPRRDPWQQKLLTELKEKQSVDGLLRKHCRFLQVPDLLHVAAGLKEHASRSSATNPKNICEMWTRLYTTASVAVTSSTSKGRRDDDRENFKCQNSSWTIESHSVEDSLRVLGLDDSLDEGTSDPVVTRGAHLSLIYLRHLKLRELQVSHKALVFPCLKEDR